MHLGLIGGIGVAATVNYYQRLTAAVALRNKKKQESNEGKWIFHFMFFCCFFCRSLSVEATLTQDRPTELLY